VAEAAWPSPRVTPRRWTLNPGRLDEAPGAETVIEVRSPQSIGLAAGEWCGFAEGDAPTDQRDDDARSLTFDSTPLAERLEILGAPVALLELAVDRPQALLAARLNEVLPDGSSVRVTYGVLNLTLVPGRRCRVHLHLNHVAHAFAAGNRLRFAVSTAYWPIVWPSPAAATLTLFTGASAIDVPVRPAAPEDARLPPFAPPEGAPLPAYSELRPLHVERTVERDGATGEVVYTIASEGGAFRAGGPGRMEAIDLELEEATVRRYRIRDDDPLSARAEVVRRMGLRRGEWAVRVETRATLRASADRFELRARLEAFEGPTLVRARAWEHVIPRDGA